MSRYNNQYISMLFCLLAKEPVCRTAKNTSLPIKSAYQQGIAVVLILQRQYYWLDQVGTIDIAK